jgi:hypothetical protein
MARMVGGQRGSSTRHAARTILERLGRPAAEPPKIDWLDREHCPHCGEPLMKFVPGAMLTREQVVAFGQRSGIESCQQGYWLHPGVYCPFGCVAMMMEFRKDCIEEDRLHPGQPPTYGPEFVFEDNAVGSFLGAHAPRTPGRHRYEPFRGLAHFDMQTVLRNGGMPRCSYDTEGFRVTFTMTDCPEYGILDLQEFEESPLNRD